MKRKCLAVGVSICAVVLLVLGSSLPSVAYSVPDIRNPSTLKTSLYKDDSGCSIKLQDDIALQLLHPDLYKQWISPSEDWSRTHVSAYESTTSSKHKMNNPQQITYDGKTLYVGGTGPGNYSTIQMAVWAASDGDTVYVYAGTYRRWFSSIMINKSIRLLGEDPASTIIIGKGYVQGEPVIEVIADAVTISGFTLIRDLPKWCILHDPRDCGIWIYENNCVVSGNIFTKSVNGVLIGSPYDMSPFTLITVSNNVFRDNSDSGLIMYWVTQSIIENNSFFGTSVVITWSYHNRFTNNTFNGKPLIILDDTSDVIIQEASQVVLIGCTNITVVNITITGPYIGIWLQHSQRCTITGNYLEDCYEGGIYLEWSDNNTITNNVIDNCFIGLLLGDSHNNRVQMNYIAGNILSSLFMSVAEQNVIDQNTFDNNAFYTEFQGIYLTGGTKNNDITNNTLINDTLYIQDAQHNRIINNTVNGKPLIYLEGASGNIIDSPAGQIVLINCDNVEVKNQTDIVIHVFGCEKCRIENVSLRTNKYIGVFICYSHYINITNCFASEDGYGMCALHSSHLIYQNNLFRKNIYVGLYIGNSTDVSVEHNAFEENGGYFHPHLGAVHIISSNSIEVQQNNFIGNIKGAAYFDSCKRKAILWNGNYWDQPRMFPKMIPGISLYLLLVFYRFDFDWHPAQEPYDIPEMR
jgi:parallel beta-helix repeat protein